ARTALAAAESTTRTAMSEAVLEEAAAAASPAERTGTAMAQASANRARITNSGSAAAAASSAERTGTAMAQASANRARITNSGSAAAAATRSAAEPASEVAQMR